MRSTIHQHPTPACPRCPNPRQPRAARSVTSAPHTTRMLSTVDAISATGWLAELVEAIGHSA